MTKQYTDLQVHCGQHFQRNYSRHLETVGIFDKLLRCCVENFGIPRENISCFPPTAGTSEDQKGSLPLVVVEEKPNGAWGMNMHVQVNSPNSSHDRIVACLRLEVVFDGSDVSLRLEGVKSSSEKTVVGCSPLKEDAIRQFTEIVVEEVDRVISSFDEPRDKQKSFIGFVSGRSAETSESAKT